MFNDMRQYGEVKIDMSREALFQDEVDDDDTGLAEPNNDDDNEGDQLRDGIAQAMWEDYATDNAAAGGVGINHVRAEASFAHPTGL